MGRIWLLPAAIALALILVRPLSGISIGNLKGSIIQIILVGICLVMALLLMPRQPSATCDDNNET